MADLPDWTTEVAVTLILPAPSVLPELAIGKEDRYSGSALTYQTIVSWTVAAL